jgi:cysteine desulfurase
MTEGFVYLDNASTTACDPRVVEVILPYLSAYYGNPSSTEHRAGEQAERAVKTARQQVAAALGCSAREVVFTSGATESNNIAILGAVRALKGGRRKIITFSAEHRSVLRPVAELAGQGFESVVLPVDEAGRAILEAAEEEIDQDTLLVSLQLANNEVGTIQPVREIAELAHRVGALVHTDAAQALGKIPFSVDELGVDLLSASAHKLYAPKGVGVLYVRRSPGTSAPRPIMFGGGQEQGLRPGTLNVPAIVGFGAACEIALAEMECESRRLSALRDQWEKLIRTAIPSVRINGSLSSRLPGASSLTFPGVDAQSLIANCPGVALSTGSACTSGALEPSHVLLAMGLSRDDARSTLRAFIGRFTTEEEIRRAAGELVAAWTRVSALEAKAS